MLAVERLVQIRAEGVALLGARRAGVGAVAGRARRRATLPSPPRRSAAHLLTQLRVTRHGAASFELEDVGEPAERVALERVVGPRAALLALQEPAPTQLLEVEAHRGLRQPQLGHEVADADGLGGVGEQVHDPNPVRVGERLEDRRQRARLLGGDVRRGDRRAARHRCQLELPNHRPSIDVSRCIR